MSLAEQITRQMGGTWHGSYGTYPGDGHSKRDRSVSIKDAPDKAERIVLNCHAPGDSWQTEMDRLRQAGLVPSIDLQRAAANGNGLEPARYLYRDERGQVLYAKARIDRPNQKYGYQHQVDGRWRAGRGAHKPVPYRLPELIAAPADTVLYMAEGEKHADKLASWGLLATSLKDWRAEFAEHVAHRCVVILPDNDEDGEAQATKAAELVSAAGGRPIIVRLPGLRPAGDVMDWTGTPKDLAELVANTQRVQGSLSATPFCWPDPTTIKRRRWLFGYWLLRGEVTAIIAPGGVGKSTFTTGMGLSLASGQPFFAKPLPEGARSVWLWNLEDDRDEITRQVTACGLRHSVGPAECGDRLYLDSGLDQTLCTAIETQDGVRLIEPVYASLAAEIRARGIDVLIVDPFVSSHEVSENDNGKIDKVAKRWKRLAAECGISVVLVHHTKKMGGREVRAEDSRGAVALINAARSTLVLNPMSEAESDRFGISDRAERRSIVRVDDDKPNRAPPENAWWMRLESVDLGNGDGLTDGDRVGAAVPWTPPDPFEGLSTSDLYRVQVAISAGEYGDSAAASDWAGKAVADVLGFDLGDEKQKNRVKSLLRTWKANKAFAVEHRDTKKGRAKPFLIVDKWVDPSTLPHSAKWGGESGESGAGDPESKHPTPLSLERGGGGGVERKPTGGSGELEQ